MPGLITHYICAQFALKQLPEHLCDIISENMSLYNIGAQGPDMFFYYLPSLLKKKTRDLGLVLHNGDFLKFLEDMCEHTKKIKDQKDRNSAKSYIFGYLTHYGLDCATHPYIYYKTGARDASKPVSTMKYSVYHRNFETAIDVLMLKLFFEKKPAEEKLWQMIHATKEEAVHVADILSKSIDTAYDVKLTHKQVYSAMRYMSRITRVLQSKKGRRKRLIEWVEGHTVKENIYSSLIHLQDITDGIDYLNIDKKPWHMPWDNTRAFTKDFAEMFEEGSHEAIEMIKACDDFLEDKIPFSELAQLTGNRSFATGVDYDKKMTFQYHDIVYEM